VHNSLDNSADRFRLAVMIRELYTIKTIFLLRETQTIAVHKDSQWYQNWQNFKENNTYLHSLYL